MARPSPFTRSRATPRPSAATWLRGDKFEYPEDYRPEQVTEGAFGLIRGQPTRVRILFDLKVARYVERVMWHPTQKFRRTGAGLEMTMDVPGTVEVVTRLLGFGKMAAILEPVALRDELAGELARAASHYSPKALTERK